ncbi:substrate-binding domain-containing protein [Paenibacillus filicis]|uniref:Substrate-binding domain-containing protein n=1 Tax=Paenibacillus gyeongsangnamensis TaxID=3388067 RepID=A0ABT4QE78_9BACL|nr:substrate-binding domain-containing protein [Paenibacillus filicis]MCZ8515107.1 substrate-binding domain-containing protein [Paenibacillus filicis]
MESSKNLLAETEKLIDHIQSMGNEVQGTLKLGVANNFALYKLPSILGSFVEAYPKVKILLRTGVGKEVMKLLYDREIHICIESGGHAWLERKVLINSEKICIISKDKIAVEDLPSLNLIHISTPSLKNVLTGWWPKRFATPPLITMETEYVETCKRMVMNGLGVAFVPQGCLDPHDPLHIIELPTEDGERYVMESWMNYRESVMNLSIVHAFIKYISTPSNN